MMLSSYLLIEFLTRLVVSVVSSFAARQKEMLEKSRLYRQYCDISALVEFQNISSIHNSYGYD